MGYPHEGNVHDIGDGYGDLGGYVVSIFSICVGQKESFHFLIIVISVHDDHGIFYLTSKITMLSLFS